MADATDVEATLDQAPIDVTAEGDDRPLPGLVLVFAGGAATFVAVPLVHDAVELGRETPGLGLCDHHVSRRHARVWYRRGDATWCIEDRGSRNGTAVDGARVVAAEAASCRVVRIGGAVFVPVTDLRPYLLPVLLRDLGGARNSLAPDAGGFVLGAASRALRASIDHAAASRTLHVHGETGVGKELIARYYHAVGPGRGGPFVAVNCAAIPPALAERLLFGVRRGVYSGADADAGGYVLEAAGGTLFLDEIGELDLVVQAKLLRVLETREVLPLGATRPTSIDVSVCSATNEDLWSQVAAQRFRADLYYRIGRPALRVPPLRERPDELVALLCEGVRRTSPELGVDASLVEACLMRAWPGNVRELLAESQEAARRARATGCSFVTAQHLSPRAGMRPSSTPLASASPPIRVPRTLPADDVIERTLAQHGGRIASTARVLGVHRNQLRRWIEAQRARA